MSDNPQPVRQVLYGPVVLMVRELLLLVVILGASVGIGIAIQVFISDALSAGALVLALLGIEARSAYLRSVFDVYVVDRATLTRIRFGFAKRLELARLNLYADYDAGDSR